jgi:hypothetical protein
LRFASVLICAAVLAHAGAYLEPNRGQADAKAAFLARTAAGTLTAGSGGFAIFRSDGSTASIKFEGVSASARAISSEPLPGVSHYARGSDPTRWIWDVPHFRSVRYEQVYAGIDLVYRIVRETVEFDFVVSPGADPSRIRLRIPDDFSLDSSGAVIGNGVRLHTPAAWQTVDGRRVPVAAGFSSIGRHRLHFRLGDYNRQIRLTIDPMVQCATFLGGSNNDIGVRVLAGPDGAVYNAGNTFSADFPASLSADNPVSRPVEMLQQTAYVARLKSDLSAFDWSLFVGGSARQSVFDLKLDTFGNLYLLGGTTSPNFPVTTGAFRSTIDPSMTDLFLVKFDGQTGRIKASTFLGIALYQNTLDAGGRLAIDAAGGVYVGAFRLYSGAFTPTAGALQSSTPDSHFVMRLNPAMSAVVYATYWTIGSISAMEVDAAGNLWIAGTTSGNVQGYTPAFPASFPLSGVSQSPSWPNQAYLARLNATGTALLSATMLHGNGNGSGIADMKIGSDGSINLSGWTSGAEFPQVQPLAIDPLPASYPQQPDIYYSSPFLARLAPDAKSLLQSTLFYGPTYSEVPGQGLSRNFRMFLQPQGQPCVMGYRLQPTQQTAGGLAGITLYQNLGFASSLSCVNTASTGIGLRTLLPVGASGTMDLAVASDGSVLLTGSATGAFSTTPGAVQSVFGGSPTITDYYGYINTIPAGDAFLLKLSLNNPTPNIQNLYPDAVLLDTAGGGTCSTTLLGTGFAYGAAASLNGQPVTYSFGDSHHASVSFSCNLLQGGDNHITLSLPSPGGGTADSVVTGIYSPPDTVSVSPASVAQGADETKLVIRATDLTAGSVLYWNGAPRAALLVKDAPFPTSHLELVLEPPELAQPANIQVTIGNPAPGGGMSAPSVFAIQPATGPTVPVPSQPTPYIYSGAVTPNPQITIFGNGFSTGTLAFWDGVQAPVTFVSSGRITIQAPLSDLSHLGAHDVYVSNGAFVSPSVRVFVGRSIPSGTGRFDPNRKLLYLLTVSQFNSASDLLVFDTTGNLLTTVSAIASGVVAAALSADGQFLYIGANSSTSGTVLRYNTSSGAVDLQWTVPVIANHTTAGIAYLATPPDSADTVIVSTNNGQVLIYDHGQSRAYDSSSAGFPAAYFGNGYPVSFVGASRIYGGFGPSPSGSGSCWVWMDYDVFGISGGQPTCSDQPPEVQHDSGVSYLTDGSRTFLISPPWPLFGLSNVSISYALDLSHRRAWQFPKTLSAIGALGEYMMDTKQFPTVFNYSAYGTGSLYPIGDGSVLLMTPSSLLLIP